MDPVAAAGTPGIAADPGGCRPPVGRHSPVPYLLARPRSGPVQTAPYIRALLKAVRDRRPNLVDDIEEAVAIRVAKQHVTYEGDHQFTIVLEENVLRHQIGGPAVLREQLQHLRASMSLASVTLGIIPFSADRSLLHPVEMFFMFDDAQVQVELVSGWLRVTQPSEVEMYADAFRRLSEMAVYGGAARADRPGHRGNQLFAVQVRARSVQ